MTNMPNGMPSNNRRGSGNIYRGGNPQAGQPRQTQTRYRQNTPPANIYSRQVRTTTEHIRPMNPANARARIQKTQIKSPAKSVQKKKQYRFKHTKLRDFIFGFAIGLVIFGIAAIIICNALVGLLT